MEKNNLKACGPIDWLDASSSTGYAAQAMAKGEYSGGAYLLKNGEVSEETVYNQEAGVLINHDLYVPLAKQPKQKLTAVEAETYAQIEGMEIPSLEDLVRLSWSYANVNKALDRIGCGWMCTEAPLFSNLWYKGAIAGAKEDGEKRQLLFIKKAKTGIIHEYNFVFDEASKVAGIIVDHREVYLWKNRMFLPADLHLAAVLSGSCLLCCEAYWFRYARGRLSFVGRQNGGSPLSVCRDEFVVSIFSDHDFVLLGDCAEQSILRKGREWFVLEKSSGKLTRIGFDLVKVSGDILADAEESNWAYKGYYQIVAGGLNKICSVHRNDVLSYETDGFCITSEVYMGEQGWGLPPEYTHSRYRRNADGIIVHQMTE